MRPSLLLLLVFFTSTAACSSTAGSGAVSLEAGADATDSDSGTDGADASHGGDANACPPAVPALASPCTGTLVCDYPSPTICEAACNQNAWAWTPGCASVFDAGAHD